MSPIKLLSTDFDGTLIESSSTEPASVFPIKEKCSEVLALALTELIEQKSVWVINTGRTLDLLFKGLEFFDAPVAPHYVITNERHIHRYHESGDVAALEEWNRRCDEEHDLLFKTAGKFFEQVHRLVAEYEKKVTFFESASGIPDELLVTDEALLDELSARILALPGRPKDFAFQRSHIHLHFCHGSYNKGSSLSELGRLLSIQPKHTLAIGDYHNDIAMLTGDVAAMVACPSNAHPIVKETVQKAGGHISSHPNSRGSAEAIRIYQNLNDTLNENFICK
jgi:hydroxymethylpyrimidine pyrophosphatase-like HAD family hydrolase